MEPILIDTTPVHGSHARPHAWLREHLVGRGMVPEKYRVAYGTDEDEVTFPLYNGAGDWVGYQKYRPLLTSKKNNDPDEGRYYTYLPSGVDGVFGLEVLDKTDPVIYIVEGVFKAAVLHRLGFNAIAVLTNHPKRLKSWFRILKANFTLVAIGDNDAAGKKLVSFVKNGFQSPVDLDEMRDEEILDMLLNEGN